jgi:Ca-activated chloride channel family protein
MMKVMKKFCIIVSLIMIIGCGGGDGDGDGQTGTAPTIDDVVLTDENFIPKSQFDIGDTVNFIVTATDPDKNMEKLLIEQYFPNDSTGNPYYGPDVIALPSQSDITMTYYLIGRITVDGPDGNWRIEFQIEDSTGLESNVSKVFAVVNSTSSIQVLPSSHDFGTVLVGNSRAPLEVEITNNGFLELAVDPIDLSDTTNFTLDLTAGSNPCFTASPTIPAGSNCTVEVVFDPQSDGSFDANLIISSSDPVNPVINVPLKGIGKEIESPSIQVLPSSYDFGIVTPDNSPAPLEIEIGNNGLLELAVDDIVLSDTTDFTLDLSAGSNPCFTTSPTIPAIGNCTVEVNFLTGLDGEFNVDLTISSNDPSNPTFNVPLSGIRDDAVSELNVRINQVESTSCPIPVVTAYVSVTDQGGYPLTTLAADDFLITEVGGYVGFPTGAPFVSEVSETISVALVMDYYGSISGLQDSLDDMQESVDNFVDNLGQDDEAEIIKFATTIAVAQAFTSNKTLLKDAITTPLDVGTQSALYDAVVRAVNDTALRLKNRKAVIVITDGVDDDGSGNPISTNNLNGVINYANGTGVPIFTVGVGGKINSAVLQQMANDTGGQSYSAATSDNLRNIYNQLAAILFQDQYVLTYNSGLGVGDTANLTIGATETTSGATGNATKGVTPCP